MASSKIMLLLLRALAILLLPTFLNVNEQYFDLNQAAEDDDEEDDDDEDYDEESEYSEQEGEVKSRDWFEQEIDSEVKWGLALDCTEEFEGQSEFQNVAVLSTKRYGKALVIDGHLQNTELDEYIFHESLVHPSLLIHNGPKTVFIMGGGGGYAAREALKHKDIEKVIICEIDWVVAKIIRDHMTPNYEAFNDSRLRMVYNDAKYELAKSKEIFDVVIGDVSDPGKSGPSHLYTKSFYENVVKPKLKDNGVFVTQAGPAGIFTHKTVFSPLYNSLKQVFTYVVAYTALVPSFGDACGWIMASNAPFNLDPEQLNNRIGERIRGELRYLDGHVIAASTVLNKTLKNSLLEETQILTEENVNMRRVRKCGYHYYT